MFHLNKHNMVLMLIYWCNKLVNTCEKGMGHFLMQKVIGGLQEHEGIAVRAYLRVRSTTAWM